MQDKDTFCQVESQGQFYYWVKVIDIKTSKKNPSEILVIKKTLIGELFKKGIVEHRLQNWAHRDSINDYGINFICERYQ